MNGLIYGLCILCVIGSVMADCDPEEINECVTNYLPAIKNIKSKDTMCRLTTTYINCLKKATHDCQGDTRERLTDIQKQMEAMGCENHQQSMAPSSLGRSSMISGTLVAAYTLKKIFF